MRTSMRLLRGNAPSVPDPQGNAYRFPAGYGIPLMLAYVLNCLATDGLRPHGWQHRTSKGRRGRGLGKDRVGRTLPCGVSLPSTQLDAPSKLAYARPSSSSLSPCSYPCRWRRGCSRRRRGAFPYRRRGRSCLPPYLRQVKRPALRAHERLLVALVPQPYQFRVAHRLGVRAELALLLAGLADLSFFQKAHIDWSSSRPRRGQRFSVSALTSLSSSSIRFTRCA